jgi:hypothetical protein
VKKPNPESKEYEFLLYLLGNLGRIYHEASWCFGIVDLFGTLSFNEQADIPLPAASSAVPLDPSSTATFSYNNQMLEYLDGLSVKIIGLYPVQIADAL